MRLTGLTLLICATAALPGARSAAAQAAPAQNPSRNRDQTGPPPSSGGFFPLSEVRRGMMGTAWTVFEGNKPEPMQVEILGVLRGVLGPRQDLILARLEGAKPEYTGVVEGMSGSPVYIGDKLLGSLSYRIGQFSKEPIAGITPIAQMLEVRNLPLDDMERASAGADLSSAALAAAGSGGGSGSDEPGGGNMNFQAMETPLVMSGFRPQAIEFWQQQTRGTSLETVAAGGLGGSSDAGAGISAAAAATLEPGSAVSMQLVRGDVEISATCTVTYIDPKQLLACGHPVLQAGQISLPMTTAEVVTTLASPLNAFKIINTGATVGAFTEDRDSAIRGVLGAEARMIPMHITMDGPGDHRKLNVEILDLPTLTSQAMMVVLFESLLETNASTASTSYHLTGNIDLVEYPSVPLDVWASPGEFAPAPMQLALQAGERFTSLYANGARQGAVRDIDLHVEEVPRRMGVELESARLVSSDMVHAGDTVEVEATVRPWQQPERNVRIAIQLPARLGAGNLRLLVSDAATLDRTLNQPRIPGRPSNIEAVLEMARHQHAEDLIYVSLLVPEAQAGMDGETLSSVPLSVANALEAVRTAQEISLNGESAEVAGEAPAGGVLSGFQILSLHIEPGGGLN
ncbi:MAG: SpoIVB peptidase S55 [Terracidiphilus sp.]